MMYYLKLAVDNTILDAISYPVNDYIKVEVPDPFPAGINGGWYKWENNTYIEMPERRPVDEIEQRLNDVEQRLNNIEKAVAVIPKNAV